MGVLKIVSAILLFFAIIAAITGIGVIGPGAAEKTELYTASEHGDLAEVRRLLGNECTDVNKPIGHDKTTPLDIAALNNHTQVVMLLLSCNADPNFQDAVGWTPLKTAARHGDVGVVRVLLGAGADIDVQGQGWGNTAWTALMLASDSGNVKIAKALISAEAKLDIKGKLNNHALTLASQKGNLYIVKALISAGADVDLKGNNGFTALMLASSRNHLDIVKSLISAGAKLDQRDKFKNWTALMLASSNCHLGVVRSLISAGAKADLQRDGGMTALILATEMKQDYAYLITKELVEYGANVNIQTNDGDTALHVAVRENLPEKAKLLLKHGADAMIKTTEEGRYPEGKTAEDIARKEGFTDILQLIQQSTVCSNLYQ